MSKTLAFGLAGVAVSAAMLGFGFYAGKQQPAIAAATPPAVAGPIEGRAQIEQVVRDYLLANPELMVEVQAALESRQEEKQRVAQQSTIASDKDLIFNGKYDGWGGNPQGDVTLVEFFDYNCGFCKRAFPDMLSLVKDDPQVRVVYKEFPILGPDSQKAHVVSMAFRALMPQKWTEFHHSLMGMSRATEESALRIALSLGADEAALRKEMENPQIGAAFEETYNLATKLAITGTPSYVVGKEVVFGALGKAVLEEKVALARGCGEETC
ncbi:DsbA family protein [Mesorhizobium sp. J428]|uniref:DsbA family protein n=1 Tax=Mesorhizobium sp. J428 TaxID=2898440 RepID=UPI0021508CD8|nr:DsbA family protein [Mesorhizobium sp. J428]MCR5859870.1 DsbA family protein [Mesorhizobium sp. J428]